MLMQILRVVCLYFSFWFVVSTPYGVAEVEAEEDLLQSGNLIQSTNDNDKVLDLDELITICLENNRNLEVVRQRLLQSKGQLTQAWSNYLPHLTVSSRLSYTEREDAAENEPSQPLHSEPGGMEQRNDGVDGSTLEKGDVLFGAVNVTQLIYDFGKTTGLIDSDLLNMKAVEAELQRKEQDVIYQVKDAYYNILEKRWLIVVAAESARSFGKHLERASLYLKAGVRTKIDVINAEVELSNAKMSLLKAEYNLKIARVELEKILGTKPYSGNYRLYEDDIQLETLLETMPPITGSIESLIKDALSNRPDVVQLKRVNESVEARINSIHGEYWPTITAEAGFTDYDTELSQYKDSWEVGVAASWELFSGLRTKGESVEAQAELLENKAKLQDLELTVVREVTESYLRADENRQGVEIALKTLALAKENVNLAEKRYKTGANDVLEFNDAQLRLTSARGDLVVAYFNYLSALAEIEYAGGNLSPQKPL